MAAAERLEAKTVEKRRRARPLGDAATKAVADKPATFKPETEVGLTVEHGLVAADPGGGRGRPRRGECQRLKEKPGPAQVFVRQMVVGRTRWVTLSCSTP